MKAYAHPRPIRVVYLVEENDQWPMVLEAIYAESYGRWGGRFTLIVPCEKGVVHPAFVPWLAAYDADIIYSYADLSDTTVEQIHERFGPAFLVKHSFLGHKERDHHAHRPSLPVMPLSVLSITGILTRGGMMAGPEPIAIIDTHIGSMPSPFVQQNFGCYCRSLNPWPIARDMGNYLKAVTLVPEEIRANPNLVPRAEGDTVSSEPELIDRIAKQRDLIGLAQLSSRFVPRLELGETAWSRTVNFVVGDSFINRLLFWNAIHFTPAWLSGGLVALKVSHEDLSDADRLNAIVKIIQNRIYLPNHSNTTHARIVVRSACVLAPDLELIASGLKQKDRLNDYTSEHIASLDAITPPSSAFESSRKHVHGTSIFQPQDWHEMSVTGASFRPPIVLPRHLSEAPQLPSHAKQGLWQIDFDLERSVNHSGIENVQHRWKLPRRFRMVSAFTRGYQLYRSHICMPRATSDGLLSLACGIDGTMPEIRLPTDEDAFRSALIDKHDWWPFTSEEKPARLGPVFALRPSDKGRYLTALLRKCGDIHQANRIFLSGFWKTRFERLGATQKTTAERTKQVVGSLRKRLREGRIESEDDWIRLSKVVMAEARAERFPSRYLKFDHLRADFDQFRKAYWATQTSLPQEWDEDEMRSLAASVTYLCQREILHQGHEWLCPQCYNKNWVGIDDMKRTMACEVCGRNSPAPVADPWHFKINGFVLTGLREHGLLPVVWCLGKYADRSEASFYYLASHELFFSAEKIEKGESDAEMDLLVVSDGVVHLIEAKASDQEIEVSKIADLAKRLRPDTVTLAVMESQTQALTEKLLALQQELLGSEISAELMTLEPSDVEEAPLLPTGMSRRVRIF